ncbi:MAG: hypothetical protein ACRYFW_11910 [Janthinobacterium lividum]
MVLMFLVSLASATPLAAQTAPKPAAASDKTKCKSHVETGTLAKMVRECHTPAEWQRMAEQQRGSVEAYRQAAASSRSGT